MITGRMTWAVMSVKVRRHAWAVLWRGIGVGVGGYACALSGALSRIECDHGRLKARLRQMRGLRTDRTASTVIRGHAFIEDLRRGHYGLGVKLATSA